MIAETAEPRENRRAGHVAFLRASRLAAGALPLVAAAVKRAHDREPDAALLIFDRETAEVVDLDLRGNEADVLARLAPPATAPPKRGRPKLGVVAREVTLLPRHWEWLAHQTGGASIALRRLVETARKGGEVGTQAQGSAAYRFMTTMAGDLPGYEEATRALFAGDHAGLERCIAEWPPDVRDEALRFADGGGNAGSDRTIRA